MPNYNPDPSLPLYGGYDPDDTYNQVTALDGRVADYMIDLHLGTTWNQVLAIVAGQLPKDAHLQWTSHQDRAGDVLRVVGHRVSVATHSTWWVIGNASKARRFSRRQPPLISRARSRARVAGSQET
jgi:hypothetical protein